MGQQQFNEAIDELFEATQNKLPQYYGRLTRANDRARLMVEDILAKHAGPDSVVPRNKSAAVTRELQQVESQVYRDIRSELQRMFEEAAFAQSSGLALAVSGALDVAALLAVAGIAQAYAESASYLLAALIGKPTEEFTSSLSKAPFNRKDSDGLQLNDRLRDIARTTTRQVASTLRKSIRNGEVTSRMNRKVARDFNSLAWRLKTIVETETLYLHRNAIGMFAELTDITRGVKIVDYPHGKPGEHERHKCHIYAHQNEHGLGEGVYPPGTRKIRHPHPRCRSTLHLELVRRLK
ncbi:hypothetical protein [Rossellomorea marisflavi]|uniref:hypothetical protein n=1 Tax=Rossellomorea marisflavi TaxID=189381 RepID=UPI0009A70204|nr:hypothetical protein [Rossellomorea marisflavi]